MKFESRSTSKMVTIIDLTVIVDGNTVSGIVGYSYPDKWMPWIVRTAENNLIDFCERYEATDGTNIHIYTK